MSYAANLSISSSQDLKGTLEPDSLLGYILTDIYVKLQTDHDYLLAPNQFYLLEKVQTVPSLGNPRESLDNQQLTVEKERDRLLTFNQLNLPVVSVTEDAEILVKELDQTQVIALAQNPSNQEEPPPEIAAGTDQLPDDFPLQMFTPSSPWNTVIDSSYTVDPNSDRMIEALKTALRLQLNPELWGPDWFLNAPPIYPIDFESTPQLPVYQTGDGAFLNLVDPNLDGIAQDVPFPQDLAPAPGSDSNIILLDADVENNGNNPQIWEATGYIYDSEPAEDQYHNARTLSTWYLADGDQVYPNGFPADGSGTLPPIDEDLDGDGEIERMTPWLEKGTTGAGTPITAGVITYHEMKQALEVDPSELPHLNHALAFSGPTNRRRIDSNLLNPSYELEFEGNVAARTDAAIYSVDQLLRAMYGPFYRSIVEIIDDYPVDLDKDGVPEDYWGVGWQFIPEGARLQLDPSLTEEDFEAMELSEEAKIVARTLQIHGAYLINASPDFGFFMENMMDYDPNNDDPDDHITNDITESKWYELAPGIIWDPERTVTTDLVNIPLDHFQVLRSQQPIFCLEFPRSDTTTDSCYNARNHQSNEALGTDPLTGQDLGDKDAFVVPLHFDEQVEGLIEVTQGEEVQLNIYQGEELYSSYSIGLGNPTAFSIQNDLGESTLFNLEIVSSDVQSLTEYTINWNTEIIS